MVRKWLFVLGLILSLSLAACSTPAARQPAPQPSPSPESPTDGGTAHLSMWSPPKGIFYPALADTAYDAQVINLVYQSLLRLGPQLELLPSLAESYTVSDDNRTVTFRLRAGVTWHDGKPFTAKDVAFTFKQMLAPGYSGLRTSMFTRLLGAADYRAGKTQDVPGIVVVDDRTVSFRVDEPYAPLVYNLGTWNIVPEHIFGSTDPKELAKHPAVAAPVGTGPFKFKEYRPNQFVELVRNEQFFRGAPHLNRVLFHIVDQQVGLGQFIKGELDLVNLTPQDLPTVESMSGAKVWEYPQFTYQYMGVNTRNSILADVRVRQALAYGINRQGIVDQILNKRGVVLNSPLVPISWAYDAGNLNAYPFDPNKAKQLLADAGFKEKDAAGFLMRDGKRLAFKLSYPKGDPLREKSAPIIQANLKEIGIDLTLDLVGDVGTLVTKVFTEYATDLWLLAWGLAPDPDGSPIWDTADANGRFNKATGWQDDQANDLLRQGVRLLKPEERKPIYVKWAQILNRDLPYVFLYSPNEMYASSARLQGVQIDVRGATWNAEQWWIARDQQRSE